MKYNDNQYHVEYREFEYFGGYKQSDWTIVNVYGEVCNKNGISLRFANKDAAFKYCIKANICNDGGICTNFT